MQRKNNRFTWFRIAAYILGQKSEETLLGSESLQILESFNSSTENPTHPLFL